MANPKFFYDNRLNDGTPVASTTAAGDFNVLNLLDFRPYTWWKPTALPATVTINSGSSKAADFALIYGHDLFTQGATVEIRKSTDNFAANDVLVATRTPTSDDPILLTFNSTSSQYWRVKITGAGGMPSVAIALIGAALTAPVAFQGTFDPVGRIVHGQTNKNENGQPLGRVVLFEEWAQTLNLIDVPWSFYRATFLPAWRSNLRGQPFGFCWDSDNYADEVRLVQAGDQLSVPHRAGSWCTISFDVSGVHYS